jgi:hypothetical protein
MRLFLPVFVSAMTAVAACTSQAQSSIPSKPGLWESTMTSNITGIQVPPDMEARLAQMPPDQQATIRSAMGGGPHTSVVHSCLTREQFDKWNDNFTRGKDGECTHSNVSQTANERSFDISCTSPNAKTTGHVDMVFDGDEHGRGTVHMVRTATQGPQAMKPMTIDMKIDTHYIGADCGAIKPGEAQPVK